MGIGAWRLHPSYKLIAVACDTACKLVFEPTGESNKKRRGQIMSNSWLFAVLLLLVLPTNLAAQEPYLVAYAGFAGFQAPVWA
jgi:hypothetical protein